MRALFLVPLLALGACAAPEASVSSLAPRAAEAIDPRVPIVAPEAAAPADPALVRQLEALVAQALAGVQAFDDAAAEARRLAAAAGARESESWVVAQEALSVAVAARAPVTRAVGEIDALGARQILEAGGIAPANLAAIRSAAARVGEIDERQAAAISAIQAMLRR